MHTTSTNHGRREVKVRNARTCLKTVKKVSIFKRSFSLSLHIWVVLCDDFILNLLVQVYKFQNLPTRGERGDGQLGLFLMTRQCLLLLFSLAVRWAMLAFFKSKLLLRDWKVRATWFRWTTLISSLFIFYILCLLYSSTRHYNGWKVHLCIIRAKVLSTKHWVSFFATFLMGCTLYVSRTRVYDDRFSSFFFSGIDSSCPITWTFEMGWPAEKR